MLPHGCRLSDGLTSLLTVRAVFFNAQQSL